LFLVFEIIIHINTIIEATTALGALQQFLFVGVSPPASLLDCSLCLDMLSLSDAYSRASTVIELGIHHPRKKETKKERQSEQFLGS